MSKALKIFYWAWIGLFVAKKAYDLRDGLSAEELDFTSPSMFAILAVLSIIALIVTGPKSKKTE